MSITKIIASSGCIMYIRHHLSEFVAVIVVTFVVLSRKTPEYGKTNRCKSETVNANMCCDILKFEWRNFQQSEFLASLFLFCFNLSQPNLWV